MHGLMQRSMASTPSLRSPSELGTGEGVATILNRLRGTKEKGTYPSTHASTLRDRALRRP